MEFCIQTWSPYMVKDIEVLEKVQHRVTRMVPGLKRLPYEDRLRRLDIYSLTARRLRGDLIETYKLLHGYTNVDYRIFFQKHDDHPDQTALIIILEGTIGSCSSLNQRRDCSAECTSSVRECSTIGMIFLAKWLLLALLIHSNQD